VNFENSRDFLNFLRLQKIQDLPCTNSTPGLPQSPKSTLLYPVGYRRANPYSFSSTLIMLRIPTFILYSEKKQSEDSLGSKVSGINP
jgi:hypothetical protein